jgi:hypothetical protein
MPIRPDLRKFYTGPDWKAARARTLERSGNRCQRCYKPRREWVWTATGRMLEGDRIVPVMRWSMTWFQPEKDPRIQWFGPARRVKVKVGVAHRNHTPGDNRDENLAGWCDWCHLVYDRGKHHETRAAHKDAARPLLQATE